MVKVLQFASLRAFLAVLFAASGLFGLSLTASAQDAIDVTIEAGSSGVDVFPEDTTIEVLNEANERVDGAMLAGEPLPTSAPQRIPGTDGIYTIAISGVDATTATVTVIDGVPEPAAVTLTLLGGDEEPPVLEGPVWTSVYVALPDDASGSVGMAWALDNADTGERLAEGSDVVDLPQWLINVDLDLGTYNLSLDARPDYAPIQTQIVIDASTAQYHSTEGYWYAQFAFTLEPAEAPDNGDGDSGDGDNGEGDNGDPGDGADNGDGDNVDNGEPGDGADNGDNSDGEKASGDTARDGAKSGTEDVKTLPATGTGTSAPMSASVFSIVALIAALVTAAIGMRVRSLRD